MQFALVAIDQPNSVQRRLDIRPDHLKHLEAMGDNLLLAGPFLDDAGAGVGSIVVIEAASLDEARAMFNRDPYVAHGLFDTVIIKPWKLNINKTK